MRKILQTLKEENEATKKNLPANQMCARSWEHFGGKSYYFSAQRLTWEQSRHCCRTLGGDLVKNDRREEQEFLAFSLRGKMSEAHDKFWIGLTDSEEENQWVWVDGSPLDTSLSFWNGNEPDNWSEGNPDGEDCVRMGRSEGVLT
ncbi:hypothetical protein Q5P01_018655 [Channa striata]|uniref:C-type lectin domain-containing protein n=1 Tax=Channa striata TaxID=64152 RepID=A0AA88SG75_CHASR|nr:hypothetical protein Q5P01_018655 [Channa striata]